MNVQELIDELMKVEDKTQQCYSFNAEEEIEVVEGISQRIKGKDYSDITGVVI